MDNLAPMTISKLAQGAGVNVETVRFYQRRGLMRVGASPAGGFRVYTLSDLSRLHFIKAAQRIGFTLDEVAELLVLDDGTSCVKAKGLAEIKLADVRKRLLDLRQMEAELVSLIDLCGEGRVMVSCPLIDALKRSPVGTHTLRNPGTGRPGLDADWSEEPDA